MRHQFWGIHPKAAAATLTAKVERLKEQLSSLESLLLAERARTASLRHLRAEQEEAIARAEAETQSLHLQLSAAAAEIQGRQHEPDPNADPKVALQEERLQALRRQLENVCSARAGLVQEVWQQLLRTEAGEADGEKE